MDQGKALQGISIKAAITSVCLIISACGSDGGDSGLSKTELAAPTASITVLDTYDENSTLILSMTKTVPFL